MKKTVLFITVIFVTTAFNTLSAADLFTAEIYLQGSEKGELVYNYTNTIDQAGDRYTLKHLYSYPSGRLFASEEVVLVDGVLLTHKTSFPDIQEESLLSRAGEELELVFTREGKEKSKSLSFPENLIFGPTQQDYIIDNLNELKNNKRIEFSLPVPEFLTTTRFTMKRIKDSEYQRDGAIVVEMRSNNILLFFLTKPIQFVLDDNSGQILEIHGPTVLKWRVKNKWEFLKADIYFSYE